MEALSANFCAFCSEIATLKKIWTCLLGKRHSVKGKKPRENKIKEKIMCFSAGGGQKGEWIAVPIGVTEEINH